MSMEIHVFFRGELPAVAALGNAMKELGFPLSIEPAEGSLEQQRGFMPMLLQGEKTGVEFDVFNGPFDAEDFGLDVEVDPSFDRRASFRWAGDEKEMLCGLCGAASLAKLINGIVLEEMEGILLSPDEAIRMARENVQAVTR